MKRKRIVTVISVCIAMLCSTASAFATISEVPEAGVYANNYLSASASISLSSGTATVSGKITGIAGQTTKTSVHLYLQQYKSGSWQTVKDWTSTGSTMSRSLSKSKSVTKGYKYRAKAVCQAYVGSKVEKVTKYSKTVSY